MNGDLDEAVGLLAPPTLGGEASPAPEPRPRPRPEDHWRWRLRMAQRIAARIDPGRFGVKAAYVFGSTKNGTAGPASDIDLLLHVEPDGPAPPRARAVARRLEPVPRRDRTTCAPATGPRGCSTSTT